MEQLEGGEVRPVAELEEQRHVVHQHHVRLLVRLGDVPAAGTHTHTRTLSRTLLKTRADVSKIEAGRGCGFSCFLALVFTFLLFLTSFVYAKEKWRCLGVAGDARVLRKRGSLTRAGVHSSGVTG